MDKETEIRFFSKVDFNGPNGCWEWQAGTFDGYGQFYFDCENRANRVSYKFFYGEIPEGLLVRHKCHNRRCVNPDHLELGNHQDNTDDRTLARRQFSKLNPEDVIEIRNMYSTGDYTQMDIADIYGISNKQVSKITRGTRWGHLLSDNCAV